jgi:hypothetical protein
VSLSSFSGFYDQSWVNRVLLGNVGEHVFVEECDKKEADVLRWYWKDFGVVSMLFSGFAVEPWLANTAIVSVIIC